MSTGCRCWSGESDVAGGGWNAPQAGAGMVSVLAETVVFVPDTPEASYSDDFHDRFVVIDNAELHNLGSSVNCLGRRLTTYTTRDAKEIRKILSQLP